MREIKVRAWDEATKTMLIPEEPNNWRMYCNGTSAINGIWRTKDLILMLYTGFKDKNKIEIYEGDVFKPEIVSEECPILVVVYDEFSYLSMLEGECDPWGQGICPCKGEVIGNIYENPDLLKEV